MPVTVTVTLPGPAPWGFRISGGRDFGKPITVSKVTELGKAAAGGLRPGDVIVTINGHSAAEMLHVEAQNKIKQSLGQLRLEVERSPVSPPSHTNGDTSPERLATRFQDTLRMQSESQGALRSLDPGLASLTHPPGSASSQPLEQEFTCPGLHQERGPLSRQNSSQGPLLPAPPCPPSPGLGAPQNPWGPSRERRLSSSFSSSSSPNTCHSQSSEPAMRRLEEDSEVYKMLQERRELRAAPRQSSTFRLLQEALEDEEGGGPAAPFPSRLSAGARKPLAGVQKLHVCEKCGSSIATQAVRIQEGRYRHPSCYTCADCGLSLKMRGHFWVGDELFYAPWDSAESCIVRTSASVYRRLQESPGRPLGGMNTQRPPPHPRGPPPQPQPPPRPPSSPQAPRNSLKLESEDSGVDSASNEHSPSTPLGSESSFSLDGFLAEEPPRSPGTPRRLLQAAQRSRRRQRCPRQLSRRSSSTADLEEPPRDPQEEPQGAAGGARDPQVAVSGQGLRYLEHVCQMLERLARLQQDNRALRQRARSARPATLPSRQPQREDLGSWRGEGFRPRSCSDSQAPDSGVDSASNEHSPSTPLGSESSFSLDGFLAEEPPRSPGTPRRLLQAAQRSRRRQRCPRQLSRRSSSTADLEEPPRDPQEEPQGAAGGARDPQVAVSGQGLRYLEHVCQMLERLARLQQDNRALRQRARSARPATLDGRSHWGRVKELLTRLTRRSLRGGRCRFAKIQVLAGRGGDGFPDVWSLKAEKRPSSAPPEPHQGGIPTSYPTQHLLIPGHTAGSFSLPLNSPAQA
ncbi:hypothetical protein HGM15179_015145 [Zosterops borbonicus]|uniref:PDZ and LIM domain protein 2 n=1 Tax=Zosterops borbonicus TaxID=364589 RepID=A0A8K1G508_9PASS|nr:hypothetical protein HGM15179_015145 [Zosterops borbonicus]